MHRIALLPCDGIGPEVVAEGLKVLAVAADKYNIKYETIPYDVGAERYLRTGETLPDSVMEELAVCDAIYLGAVGHPDVQPGVLETPLAGKGPEDIDFVVVRENTECLYCGVGGTLKKGTPDEVATQTAIYTRKGVERIIRYAFDLCVKRNDRLSLTLVDKANVLTFGHDLWRRTFAEVLRRRLLHVVCQEPRLV